MDRYDVLKDEWTRLDVAMPCKRYGTFFGIPALIALRAYFASQCVGGEIYMMGGRHYGTESKEVSAQIVLSSYSLTILSVGLEIQSRDGTMDKTGRYAQRK